MASEQAPPNPSFFSKRRPAYILLLGAAVSLALFFSSFNNGFRADDHVFFNDARSAATWVDLLTPSPHFAFYRPGARVLFWMEYKLVGAHSGLYLVFNYLVFLATAFVFLRLLEVVTTTANLRQALSRYVAVSLFLIGAFHFGKQVMWASAGGPLVSALLSTAALWLAAKAGRAHRETGHIPLSAAAGVLGASGLAPVFHEYGLITPLLLVLVLGSLGVRLSVVLRFAALLAFPLVFWGITLSDSGYPAYQNAVGRVAAVPYNVFEYLGFMALPIQPSMGGAIGGRLGDHLMGVLPVLRVSASLGVAVALIVAFRRHGGAVRFAVLWWVLALCPFAFVEIPRMRLELRYVYVAAMPACWLLARAVVCALAADRRVYRIAAATVLLAACIGTVFTVMRLERKYDSASSRVERRRTGPADAGVRESWLSRAAQLR